MRRLVGRLVDEAGPDGQHTSRRMDLGDLQRLGGGERGQEARQALGQHGLAAPRWSGEQQVVATGSRHLEGGTGHGLAPDVGEVRAGRRSAGGCGPCGRGHGASPLSALTRSPR